MPGDATQNTPPRAALPPALTPDRACLTSWAEGASGRRPGVGGATRAQLQDPLAVPSAVCMPSSQSFLVAPSTLGRALANLESELCRVQQVTSPGPRLRNEACPLPSAAQLAWALGWRAAIGASLVVHTAHRNRTRPASPSRKQRRKHAPGVRTAGKSDERVTEAGRQSDSRYACATVPGRLSWSGGAGCPIVRYVPRQRSTTPSRRRVRCALRCSQARTFAHTPTATTQQRRIRPTSAPAARRQTERCAATVATSDAASARPVDTAQAEPVPAQQPNSEACPALRCAGAQIAQLPHLHLERFCAGIWHSHVLAFSASDCLCCGAASI